MALDVDDNRSMWASTAGPWTPGPPLRGDVTADVAIIGAGFTGMSTALHLRRLRPDLGIVVLEAKAVGNGASGRSGGMVLNWINGIDTHEETLTRRVWDCTKGGIDHLEQTLADEGLDVPFRRDGCLETFTSAARAEEAHQKVERLNGWGIPLRYLQGAQLRALLRAEGVVGAILDPTAGQIHGLRLVRELARVLRGRGVDIYEDSPVTAIEEGATHVLHTPQGRVRAAAMVLATNGYTPRLGYFRSGLFPLHSHVIATAPLSPAEWERLGWGPGLAGASDDLDRISYGSMTPDGRLLFGGGSNRSYAYVYGDRTTFPRDTTPGFQAVRDVLLRYLPGTAGVPVADRWVGTLGITMDRQLTVGVMGAHKNVYYGLGYSGHGVVLANVAGRVIADLYTGQGERWKDQPFLHKRLLPIPPEPLRWVGYHAYTTLTGKSPRRVS